MPPVLAAAWCRCWIGACALHRYWQRTDGAWRWEDALLSFCVTVSLAAGVCGWRLLAFVRGRRLPLALETDGCPAWRPLYCV